MVRKKGQALTLKTLLGIIFSIAALLALGIEFIFSSKPQSLALNLQNATVIAPAVSIAPLLTNQLDATAFNYTPFLHGKWGVMYVSTEMCTQACLDAVSKLLAVKNKLSATQPMYIMFVSLSAFKDHNPLLTELLQKQLPTIWYVDATDSALQSFFNQLPAGTQTLHSNELYIIDKNMQAIAAYSPSTSGKTITKELSAYLR